MAGAQCHVFIIITLFLLLGGVKLDDEIHREAALEGTVIPSAQRNAKNKGLVAAAGLCPCPENEGDALKVLGDPSEY